jgi:hypothetical protein
MKINNLNASIVEFCFIKRIDLIIFLGADKIGIQRALIPPHVLAI